MRRGVQPGSPAARQLQPRQASSGRAASLAERSGGRARGWSDSRRGWRQRHAEQAAVLSARHGGPTSHPPPPPLNTQPITKDELALIAGPASMHAIGHVAANLSFAAVAISLTHTVKTMEPIFNVVLSQLILGTSTPLPVILSLVPIMVGAGPGGWGRGVGGWSREAVGRAGGGTWGGEGGQRSWD